MLKIKYKTAEVELEIESDSPLNEEMLNGIMSVLEKMPSPRPVAVESKVERVLQEVTDPPFEDEDFEPLRGRLPNTFKKGGAVDMSELEVSTPNKATAHHNFRCPSCLQSSVAVIDNSVLIRDIEAKTGGTYMSVGVNLEDFKYKEAVTQVTERVTLVADGESEAHCPLCNHDDVVEKWVDAYSNPLNYSEFEHPCPVCGGETVTIISPDGSSQLECERLDCRYKKKLEE